MSTADKAADTALNVAADVVGEVSTQAENAEQALRSLNRTKVQFALGGWLLGAVTGAFFAYKYAYSQAEEKYSKIVDEEISNMRQHYMEKGKALESEAAKDDLGTIVAEKGYAEPSDNPYEPNPGEKPPMVVQPPTPSSSIIVGDVTGEDSEEEPEVQNLFRKATPTHQWDWHEERKGRSPDVPYVIHVDEKEEMDYQSETLTYYEGDDVLCNERDEIIDPDYRNELIGEDNLDRFGHGSNDVSVVYVRNDKLEIMYEIVRSPHKFAEEVHGFHHSGYGKNLERMRVRERDEQED